LLGGPSMTHIYLFITFLSPWLTYLNYNFWQTWFLEVNANEPKDKLIKRLIVLVNFLEYGLIFAEGFVNKNKTLFLQANFV
jgi:hypothetical protein